MAKGRISNVVKAANYFENKIKKHPEEFEDETKFCQTVEDKINWWLNSEGCDGWDNMLDACKIKTFTLEEVRDLEPKFEEFYSKVESEVVNRLTNLYQNKV